MKVLFLHGYGSDPEGIRPTFLRQHGYEVLNPALPDEDFDESVRIARRALEQGQPDVVVGSSRGGAVALHLDLGATPLVLIAPAWRKWAAPATVARSTVILHSPNDDVIPVGDSRELLQRNGLTEHHLVVAGEDHKMTDDAAFAALLEAIERFGSQ